MILFKAFLVLFLVILRNNFTCHSVNNSVELLKLVVFSSSHSYDVTCAYGAPGVQNANLKPETKTFQDSHFWKPKSETGNQVLEHMILSNTAFWEKGNKIKKLLQLQNRNSWNRLAIMKLNGKESNQNTTDLVNITSRYIYLMSFSETTEKHDRTTLSRVSQLFVPQSHKIHLNTC